MNDMRLRSLTAAALAVMLGLFLLFSSGSVQYSLQEDSYFFARKTTLRLWYTDDSLTDYLGSAAVAYSETSPNYRIEPHLIDGVEFLERINEASVKGSADMPDLYIIGNTALGRAKLAGLTSPVEHMASFADTVVFPEAAIRAVRCDGEIVAYPFYFETAALLYNREYLSSMAEAAELDPAAAVPSSMDDIRLLADHFDAPEHLRSVFEWDVREIQYNYFFLGGCMDIGGSDGDDPSIFELYNAETVDALRVYKETEQFFEARQCADYEEVLTDFINGRCAFAIATSEAPARIREAAKTQEGGAPLDYGVTYLPSLDGTSPARGMSITNCLVVNGYSAEKSAANDFITFMLFDYEGDFYNRTGKAPALNGYRYTDPHMRGFYEAYTRSVPASKLRETGNFRLLLETGMSRVLEGMEPEEALRQLYEQMVMQLTGNTEFKAMPLEDAP